ncbi:MAG: hypothetical protein COB34_06205 [Methylophilaceae bacterium]|nr:MAG: hypothetical protein COB34_06205 [Methylophilaceae bacterium]
MFKYLVLAMRTPRFQQSVINPHIAFLDSLRKQGKLEMSGPFTDKTGGAYLIKAANIEDANAIAFTDPLHTTKSSIVSVCEWSME